MAFSYFALCFSAHQKTTQPRPKILQRDFNLISDWYTFNRLTLDVKSTKIMFAGSKTTQSKFEDFEFSLERGKN